jgi:hypothetical protein
VGPGYVLYQNRVVCGVHQQSTMVRMYLQLNPGNPSKTGAARSLMATWGNGSGTDKGGTGETLEHEGEMNTRMGTWAPHVKHHDSNWKELRTLTWWTMEQIQEKEHFTCARRGPFLLHRQLLHVLHYQRRHFKECGAPQVSTHHQDS